MPGTIIDWFVVEEMEIYGVSWQVRAGVVGVLQEWRRLTEEERAAVEESAKDFSRRAVQDVLYCEEHGTRLRNSPIVPRYDDERVWDW